MTLNLHAKTYYNNPDATGGDEHYIDIPDFPVNSALGIKKYCKSLGWEEIETATASRQSQSMGILGGYINVIIVLSACEYKGMEGAVLTLSTSISYWGPAMPSGSKTADWTAELTKCKYKVTRVTP